MLTKRITFDEIEQAWKQHLWQDRTTPIETHSVMTWPFEGSPPEYDMSIFEYTPTFWGTYIDNVLVGVNSGHQTSKNHYRSRGLWVHPEYRLKGVSQTLLNMTCLEGTFRGCNLVWTMPRETALPAYTKFGFKTIGGFFGTDTSESNIYAFKRIA